MKFLLDTNIWIYALKQNRRVLERLLAHSRSDVAISVIAEAELRTGAAKSASVTKTRRLVENFLRPLSIVEFVSGDAEAYAALRAKLERAGTPIGPPDTLIAAQAVARKLVLVEQRARVRPGGGPASRELGGVRPLRRRRGARALGVFGLRRDLTPTAAPAPGQ